MSKPGAPVEKWKSTRPSREVAFHPLDYPYPCGFSPFGKKLKTVVDHWRACKNERCKRALANYEDFKQQYRGRPA